jgi:CubicO group peptidase (beta-lactamase class C family)
VTGAWKGCVVVAVLSLAACTSASVTETSQPRSSPAPVARTDADPAPGFPTQPEGVPFPTESWPGGPWPIGIHKAGIDAAVDEAFAGGGDKRVRAVVIVHRGELIYERYSPNPLDGPTTVMPSFSIAKSFTSALVGILVKQKRLAVDEPAPVPEWSAPEDPRHDITVDDLLHMSSGLDWSGASEQPNPDLVAAVTSGDAAGYTAAKDLARKPGTRFRYSDGDTLLLDRIMADEVGGDFRAFMEEELLGKLGIAPLQAEFDEAGTWLGAYAADTTAVDFAKLGLLYLRDGVWDGERILPEGWVEYTRAPSTANPEYGAHWWLDLERPEVFYAVGVEGQVIAVDPVHDLTFVTLATDSAISLPVGEAIMDAFEGSG